MVCAFVRHFYPGESRWGALWLVGVFVVVVVGVRVFFVVVFVCLLVTATTEVGCFAFFPASGVVPQNLLLLSCEAL